MSKNKKRTFGSPVSTPDVEAAKVEEAPVAEEAPEVAPEPTPAPKKAKNTEVKFTQDVAVYGRKYKAGDKQSFPADVAKSLVEKGVCQ